MHRDTIACLWVSCPTNSCQTLQRSVEGYTAPITPYIKYSEHPIPSHPIAWRCKGYTRLSHIEKTRFRNRHRTHIYLHKVSLLFWKVKRAPTKLCNPSEWNKLEVNLVSQTTLFAERGRVLSSFIWRVNCLQCNTRHWKQSALGLVLGVGPRVALVMLQVSSCHHSSWEQWARCRMHPLSWGSMMSHYSRCQPNWAATIVLLTSCSVTRPFLSARQGRSVNLVGVGWPLAEVIGEVSLLGKRLEG